MVIDLAEAVRRARAASLAPRQCVRCEADIHAGDPPHLCRDVRGRLNAYVTERRQHLLRLIRAPRCSKHRARLVPVCYELRCGLCYIEEPFRPPRPMAAIVGLGTNLHFAGYGQKRPRDNA